MHFWHEVCYCSDFAIKYCGYCLYVIWQNSKIKSEVYLASSICYEIGISSCTADNIY